MFFTTEIYINELYAICMKYQVIFLCTELFSDIKNLQKITIVIFQPYIYKKKPKTKKTCLLSLLDLMKCITGAHHLVYFLCIILHLICFIEVEME